RKEWCLVKHGGYYGLVVSRGGAAGRADDEWIASVRTQMARPLPGSALWEVGAGYVDALAAVNAVPRCGGKGGGSSRASADRLRPIRTPTSTNIPMTSAAAAPVATGTTAALDPLTASATLAATRTIRASVGPIRLYPNRNTPKAWDSR